MSKTYIYVNSRQVQADARSDRESPVIIVQCEGGRSVFAKAVAINGPSQVRYSQIEGMNPTGAACWIETEAEVICDPVETKGESSE